MQDVDENVDVNVFADERPAVNFVFLSVPIFISAQDVQFLWDANYVLYILANYLSLFSRNYV